MKKGEKIEQKIYDLSQNLKKKLKISEDLRLKFMNEIGTNNKMMRRMFDSVMSRIDNCALRDDTNLKIKTSEEFLMNKIEKENKNINSNLQLLKKNVNQSKTELKNQIHGIQLKTLGKITGNT